MHRFTSHRTLAVVASVALLSACVGEAPEDDGTGTQVEAEPAIIAERQSNFEGIGDAFKLIRAGLEDGNPDFAAIASEAGTINANARKIGDHFPEGTSIDAGYETEALATIWEKTEEFTAAHQKLIEASDGLIAAAQTGDPATVKAQVGELGKSCKGCHDEFRLDDD